MGDRRAIALAFAVLAFAACGDDDDTATGATEVMETTPLESTSTTLITTTTIELVTTTIESATTTEAAPDTTAPPTTAPSLAEQVADLAEQQYAELSDADIASFGGPECATELSTILAAGSIYIDVTGEDPTGLADLVDGGYLVDPLTLFVEDDPFMRPAPGSGCLDVFASAACQVAADHLIEAQLVYLESNPGAPQPSQAELVAAGLLDEPSLIVDLVDGSLMAVPEGRCDGISLDVDWGPRCRADNMTLEVGQEAYRAQNGADANPTEAELVEAGFIRAVSPLFDIVDGTIVAVPGRPCDGVDLTTD